MTDREEELWEYIRSLQAQVDHLVDMDAARLRRIERIERDRRVLRERLAAARGPGAKSWFRTRATDAEETEASATAEPILEVPGVGAITESPMPGGPARRSLVVATILDPISAIVFAPEFQLEQVTVGDWEETTEEHPPDLLLVESAYAGSDGSWATRIARFGAPSPHLMRLVEWCQSRSIPTVFWNKEDPINFDWFIESAALFDHVFTVDSDQVPRYRATLGHDRVGVLPFFAQTDIHFPGPDAARTGTVAFAGSYFAAKHPERRKQMKYVLDPARTFGLDIFDRHAGVADDRFRWPEQYQPHIQGGLTYLQTVEAYRRYRVFLNVNTVTGSPSMCARRVFELAASGTPILSGPALALDPLEASGAIAVTRSHGETASTLRRLLETDEGHAMAARAQEWISGGNTASDRVNSLLAAIGKT